MKCNLIQELIDAHRILDQAQSLDDVIASRGSAQYTIRDWFIKHPYVMRQLRITPRNLTYQLVTKRLNQAMADLF